MRNRLIILGLFIIIFFISFIFVFLMTPKDKKLSESYNSVRNNNQNIKIDSNLPYVTETKLLSNRNFENKIEPTNSIYEVNHLSPEDTVRKFYSWYLTYQGVSALQSGDYVQSDLLSDKFKRIIGAMKPYDENEDPVFCTKNKLTNFTVLNALTTGNGRQSVIIQSVPDKKNLHKAILINLNNKWVIDDTICIP